MIDDLQEGDIVYVRMEYRRPIKDTDSAQCWLRFDRSEPWRGFHSVPVPMSQIVAREPKVMEAHDGIVQGDAVSEKMFAGRPSK